MPAKKKSPPERVMIRFTGDAGGTRYVTGRLVLERGDTIVVPLAGHWQALVKSGNAEVVK